MHFQNLFQCEELVQFDEKPLDDDEDLRFVFQDLPVIQKPRPTPETTFIPPQQQQHQQQPIQLQTRPRQHHHHPQQQQQLPLSPVVGPAMPESNVSWQQEIEIMCRDLLHR